MASFAPCTETRIPDKRLLMETEILGFGTWNAAQGIRNPTNESRIQVPQTGIQYLESGIQGVESGIQECL